MNFLYNTVVGRVFLKILLSSGMLKFLAKYLKSEKSKWIIPLFIKKNNIDMSVYPDREYESYADFFSRKKDFQIDNQGKNAFISPCDSLLSIFEINEDSVFCVKGSYYKIEELVPEQSLAQMFKDGLCMIFRLEATDYHHFCYVDNCIENGATLIPGELHSVQPVVVEKYPVFRKNKRFYHLLETENFGNIMQIEVAAVLVGGVEYSVPKGEAKKGMDAGNFELCGSTIMLLLQKEIKDKLAVSEDILKIIKEKEECPVKIGQTIGYTSV